MPAKISTKRASQQAMRSFVSSRTLIQSATLCSLHYYLSPQLGPQEMRKKAAQYFFPLQPHCVHWFSSPIQYQPNILSFSARRLGVTERFWRHEFLVVKVRRQLIYTFQIDFVLMLGIQERGKLFVTSCFNF